MKTVNVDRFTFYFTCPYCGTEQAIILTNEDYENEVYIPCNENYKRVDTICHVCEQNVAITF